MMDTCLPDPLAGGGDALASLTGASLTGASLTGASLTGGAAPVLDEAFFHAFIRRLPHRVVVKAADFTFMSCNDAFAGDFGRRAEELIGKSDRDLFSAGQADSLSADDRRAMRRGHVFVAEETCLRDGQPVWLQTTRTPIRDAAGVPAALMVVIEDITARKRAADELKRRGWALEALRFANQVLVDADSEAALLQGVCAAITLENIYPLVWIGLVNHDPQRSVGIVAAAGKAVGFTEGLTISWGEGPFSDGPTGQAIRAGQTIVNNHVMTAANFAPWRERADRHGIRSSLSVPLKSCQPGAGRAILGTLAVYAATEDAFGPGEITLFEELADGLVMGMESRRMRIAHDASLAAEAAQARKWRHSLEDTLRVIAGVLEERDSYTAGHQNRVADLAVLIGRELGLEEDRLHGLYLAGIVHDVGKIRVPPEILGKPGRLDAAEFALVKRHPEVGYMLIKGIDFPWPIADMIRQHHEYLDGTGYPLGLRSGQILYESKILTVADIVESISSDRPYRASLGIDEAARIIIEMRGRKLDEQAVDACIAVIRQGDFVPHALGADPGGPAR